PGDLPGDDAAGGGAASGDACVAGEGDGSVDAGAVVGDAEGTVVSGGLSARRFRRTDALDGEVVGNVAGGVEISLCAVGDGDRPAAEGVGVGDSDAAGVDGRPAAVTVGPAELPAVVP